MVMVWVNLRDINVNLCNVPKTDENCNVPKTDENTTVCVFHLLATC